jgi:hypothetical protein
VRRLGSSRDTWRIRLSSPRRSLSAPGTPRCGRDSLQRGVEFVEIDAQRAFSKPVGRECAVGDAAADRFVRAGSVVGGICDADEVAGAMAVSIGCTSLGRYVARAKKEPLATKAKGKQLELVRPARGLTWDPALPLTSATDSLGQPMLLASVRRREEKGSNVNVATHLLLDVLEQAVDAAIIISNDSDLALRVKLMRERVPVGVVNPGTKQIAVALRGGPTDGVGGHWWTRLKREDFLAHRLPTHIGGVHRPYGW